MGSSRTTLARSRHRGMMLMYISILMVAMLAFASLAVDVGKVQVCKTELRRAADAAAMYAAAGLSTSVTQAYNNAVASAAENTANGTPIVLTSADIEYGSWNPDTRTFTALSSASQSSATAMRITCRRVGSRGTSVALTFGGIFGMQTADVTASAVATRGKVISQSVPALACPWLAGAASGTQVAPYGGNTQATVSPDSTPPQVTGLPLTPGTKLSFQQASGQTAYAGSGYYGPDGQTGWIVRQNATNGINSTDAPLNSLVGIFLDDRDPSTWTQAAEPDFTSDTSRDFSNLAPALKQVFFIGDGLNSAGNLQTFTIPTGATRFYMGIMDEKGWWWDNVGTLQTTILNQKPTLVQ